MALVVIAKRKKNVLSPCEKAFLTTDLATNQNATFDKVEHEYLKDFFHNNVIILSIPPIIMN